MTLYVVLLILLAAVPVVVMAQQPAPPIAVADVGSAVAAVAEAVAARWGVEPGAVRVDWGASPPVPVGVAVRLLGGGAEGTFVAEYHDGSRLVRRRLRAGMVARTAVAARDVERGEVLAATDIVWQDTVVWGGPATRPDVEVGWVAHRRIAAGSVLRAPALGPPAAVSAGQPVKLIWRGAGLEVTTAATAAGTAAVGAQVMVRTASGQRLSGIVEAPGTVRIGGER
jgi:flagella basal body P-ring formation protein FlgA